MSKLHFRIILGYVGTLCATAYAVFLMYQATRTFQLVAYYYKISPDLLFAFPIIDGKVDYTKGAPVAIFLCVFLLLLAIAVILCAFPVYRAKHPKLAIVVCLLAVFSFPLGAVVCIVLGLIFFAEAKCHCKQRYPKPAASQ